MVVQLKEEDEKQKLKVEEKRKKKQSMIDMGVLNSEGFLLEKTFLKDFSKNNYDKAYIN